MICTLHRLLGKASNERRELPEATENRSQVQVSRSWPVAAELVSQELLWTNAGSLCLLQPLAQEQGQIVYRVHQGRRGVDSDLTQIHPNALPVVTKQSHCTDVLIAWSVAKSTAVTAMPIVGPVVRATIGSRHPRKRDSSMIAPRNASRRIKFQKWIT